MTKYDLQWRTDALRECWEQRLTPKQCAEYIGVSRQMMYGIFMGREWKNVPKPEGFTYPFPGLRHQRPLSEEKKAHYIAEYVRLRQTPDEFAAMVGIARTTAYCILLGHRWKEVKRPSGYAYPWPRKSSAA